jgi:hypothetical protein
LPVGSAGAIAGTSAFHAERHNLFMAVKEAGAGTRIKMEADEQG